MEKELIEKKNDLITRADEVLGKAKEEKRELTDAEAQELAEIRDNVRRIMETLKLKGEFDKMEGNDLEKEALPKDEERKCGDEDKTRALDEEKAFESYIRGTILNERATNLTPASNSGGVLIPTTIANRIIKKVYDICPILEKSTKYNVKGKLELPYYDESTQSITVAWATEFQELESNVGKFTNITLTGYLAGALSLVSRSLINNAQFDIVAFVVDRMAYDISRFIENALLNGSGSVTGLSTVSNVITTSSESAITTDDLIKVQGQIKDVFQGNAIWIMNETTRTAIRQLKSQTGSYLLNEIYDLSSPFKNTLLGKPVYVSDNMPEIGAGKMVIYYGDMSGLATKFSEDINIEVLREKYATQHAYGIVGWLEFDSKIEDPQKIAAVKMAGTTPSV
jgi:HK97 family phage major capsid protein